MTDSTNTIRVVIPLTIRKRNGRPKILPPDEVILRDGRTQDPHVLRAIARAWSWRRQLETGAASTIQGRVPRGGVGTVDPRQDQVQVRRPELAG